MNKATKLASVPQGGPVALSASAEEDVRAGAEQAARGDFADLSAEESEHYLETGELPERVRRWVDSYGSRNAS